MSSRRVAAWSADARALCNETLAQHDDFNRNVIYREVADLMQIPFHTVVELASKDTWGSSFAVRMFEACGYVQDEGEKYMLIPDDSDDEKRNSFNCLDCGGNTSDMEEYYMVTNHVWYTVTAETCGDGMMCIACLEKRLGRELVKNDFIEAPINHVGLFAKSDLLMQRLGVPFWDGTSELQADLVSRCTACNEHITYYERLVFDGAEYTPQESWWSHWSHPEDNHEAVPYVPA